MERRTFSAYLIGDKMQMQEAVQAVLQHRFEDQKNQALLVDTALCAIKLRDDRSASWAYLRAGRLGHNPQYFVLAGWAQQRAHQSKAAIHAWRQALAIDPTYAPAIHALKREQHQLTDKVE